MLEQALRNSNIKVVCINPVGPQNICRASHMSMSMCTKAGCSCQQRPNGTLMHDDRLATMIDKDA